MFYCLFLQNIFFLYMKNYEYDRLHFTKRPRPGFEMRWALDLRYKHKKLGEKKYILIHCDTPENIKCYFLRYLVKMAISHLISIKSSQFIIPPPWHECGRVYSFRFSVHRSYVRSFVSSFVIPERL